MKMLKFRDDEGQLEFVWLYAPAVLLVAVVLYVTYQFVDPAPPNRITIATGAPDGAYYAYAQRYREILARDGVTLEVRQTAGSVENIELLESRQAGVDVAFVQGGTGHHARGDTIRSLASLYYEPLWLFAKGSNRLARLSDIVDKRISIGPVGSGTRALVLELLLDAGFDESQMKISELNGMAAVEALRDGSLDVMMMVASPEAPIVQNLLSIEDVQIVSFGRADAFTRRHRYLSKLTLPEGTIDLRTNLPSRNVGLLAATANLAADKDLHPALVDLLLQATTEVHGDGGLFEKPRSFPSPQFLVFPLSEEARRYFTSGTPFLRRTLPYWAATLVDRLLLMLLPLVAIVFPLMRIMPPIYKWRVRRRAYRWYKALRELERSIQEGVHDGNVGQFTAELDHIESDVKKVKIPLAYAEELYQLRLHIRYVRETLKRQPSTQADAPRRSDTPASTGTAEDALEDAS
ncbi:MAG: TAXI family TRAP transporter solute-binding subunit [Gammaproteobacteria bacterium]|nr:TAXI family TRAP transporter solute-binding subunit [Gammaproteobacteria bacterium]NIP63076.1 TAXI family TRAP transporter solute-binding subunit [Gammaproteobacteria bacterium]NIQ25101.1 TAXI family TRAP transporter solute-binding subunit [Gammaproteobacteria bacterium]NIR18302.1 TAXI family TRAP transporter solute-binding subunit [Gammaproteobacteria bacterium]